MSILAHLPCHPQERLPKTSEDSAQWSGPQSSPPLPPFRFWVFLFFWMRSDDTWAVCNPVGSLGAEAFCTREVDGAQRRTSIQAWWRFDERDQLAQLAQVEGGDHSYTIDRSEDRLRHLHPHPRCLCGGVRGLKKFQENPSDDVLLFLLSCHSYSNKSIFKACGLISRSIIISLVHISDLGTFSSPPAPTRAPHLHPPARLGKILEACYYQWWRPGSWLLCGYVVCKTHVRNNGREERRWTSSDEQREMEPELILGGCFLTRRTLNLRWDDFLDLKKLVKECLVIHKKKTHWMMKNRHRIGYHIVEWELTMMSWRNVMDFGFVNGVMDDPRFHRVRTVPLSKELLHDGSRLSTFNWMRTTRSPQMRLWKRWMRPVLKTLSRWRARLNRLSKDSIKPSERSVRMISKLFESQVHQFLWSCSPSIPNRWRF